MIKNMFTKRKKIHFNPLMVVLLVVLIVYAVILLGLIFWAIMTSLKSVGDYDNNSWGFPSKIVDNYSYVFEKFKISVKDPVTQGNKIVSVWMMLFYGLFYALGAAFCNTAVICVTAYVCARFPNKFTKLIHSVVVVVMIIPIVGSLPSELRMAQTLGLYNSIWGLWIMKSNFLGIYFLVFFNTFRKFPEAYSEAARIDGANNFNIFFRIMLPLTKMLFSTVLLINFIIYWNDYQTPMIYMPSYPTISVGVYEVTRSNDNGLDSMPSRMAATVIMLVPTLTLFAIFSNKLLGNLTLGGIKG